MEKINNCPAGTKNRIYGGIRISTKVEGEKTEHKITCYTISTCVWCKKTKKWLLDNKYEYEYTDVDLLEGEERENINNEILKYNERLSFPTVIIDEKTVIVGHNIDKLKEALENG